MTANEGPAPRTKAGPTTTTPSLAQTADDPDRARRPALCAATCTLARVRRDRLSPWTPLPRAAPAADRGVPCAAPRCGASAGRRAAVEHNRLAYGTADYPGVAAS